MFRGSMKNRNIEPECIEKLISIKKETLRCVELVTRQFLRCVGVYFAINLVFSFPEGGNVYGSDKNREIHSKLS